MRKKIESVRSINFYYYVKRILDFTNKMSSCIHETFVGLQRHYKMAERCWLKGVPALVINEKNCGRRRCAP